MKLNIPLKDIMLAPGKRFDPASSSEKDVIERIREIYGVIADVMEISIKDDMVTIEFRDASPEKFKAAMMSLKKGIQEAGKGHFAKALKLFQEVLIVIPENVDARRNMAKIYLEQKNLEKAKQHLQECLQINPKDAYSCVMLGNIYARNENKLDLAAFYYEACLEHHPEDAMVMTNYAGMMIEKGDFQKAEVLFKKAIKIQDIPNAYYGLALLYQMAGQLEAARQVLETLFTRTADIKGLDGSPIYQQSKNLYKELSAALGVSKHSH
jgi:tetratricopeptide (TPR) repeat protein